MGWGSLRKPLLSTIANVTGAMSPTAQKELKDKLDAQAAKKEKAKAKADKAAAAAAAKDGSAATTTPPPPSTEPPSIEEKFVADEERFKDQVTQFLLVPLLSDSMISIAKALRAISLLLQSNPPVAYHLLHHAGPQGDNKAAGGSGGKSSETKKAEKSSQQQQQDADDAEALTKITPLMAITAMVGHVSHEEVKALAAEVLALASSDTLVRTTLANSPFTDSFFPLLASSDPLGMICCLLDSWSAPYFTNSDA
jgi:hypothetical protein